MAEDDQIDENQDEGDVSQKRRKALSGKKLVMFILLPLILIGAVVYILMTMVFVEEEPEVAAEDGAVMDVMAEDETGPEVDPAMCGAAFVTLPEMVVNLNSSGRTQRYLQLEVALELADPLHQPEIERLMPRLADQFQVFLREMRIDDLRGSRGTNRMRDELLYRVNLAAGDNAYVCDVLFQRMVIQ